MVGRPTNAAQARKKNLARARQLRLERRRAPPESTPSTAESTESREVSGGIERTGWNGRVSHCPSSNDEPIVVSDSGSGDGGIEEFANGLPEVMQEHPKELKAVSQFSVKPSGYSIISKKRTEGDWRKAGSHRSLGYNGQSARTKRYREHAAREKEKEDAKLRNRWVELEVDQRQ